ncbi:hypothetical protein SLEP1_g9282 [Rubroshorea leprosula]|uniref:Uncharacterized protein n=1 Tax=Rubroshorea leprosula TaxID=152421 RepID=A0AAV5IEB6_9ROSI|nr:hypothetical protein SLEP1_g9282 [Rubroshorea leprosula]
MPSDLELGLKETGKALFLLHILLPYTVATLAGSLSTVD